MILPIESAIRSHVDRWSERGLILVTAYAALIALAGLWTMPPLDRDEARFAQATVQMLETGDFISIRFQDDERNKKPAGIHWLQAASVSAFSDTDARAIWVYRLPSAAGAVMACVFVFLIAARLYDRRTGLIAGLLMASPPLLAAESTIAKTDAMLLAMICLAQLAFVHSYGRLQESRPGGWGWPALFWGAQGFAVLLKGPVGLMVSALTGLGLALKSPRLAWLEGLRPITGIIILLLIAGPWALAIGLQTEGRFFIEAIGGDMLGKIGEGQEMHGAPAGYHAVFAAVLFWPAAALIIPGLINNWRDRTRWQAHFLLAWLIPGWLVFEAAATKLPHYTLPLYPVLAIMAARAACAPDNNENIRAQRAGAVIYALVSFGAAAILIALPQLYGDGAGSPSPYIVTGVIAAGIIVAGALAATIQFWRGRRLSGALGAAALSGFFLWTLQGVVLPGLDQLAVSPNLAKALEDAGRNPITDAKEPIALSGYHEPSAIFLLGTQTQILEGADAAKTLIRGEVSAAIVEARQAPAFLDAFSEARRAPHAFAVIDGLNYSNGKRVSLTVYVLGE